MPVQGEGNHSSSTQTPKNSSVTQSLDNSLTTQSLDNLPTTQLPLNSSTTQSPNSSTYPPPTATSTQQESTTIEGKKIQPYNWDNQVKRIKQKASKDFYKIPQLQYYFAGSVSSIIKDEMWSEIKNEFSKHPIKENFSFSLRMFNETLNIRPNQYDKRGLQIWDATDLADRYFGKFIDKVIQTSGEYYSDKIIDFNNEISSTDKWIEYDSIASKISNNECNRIYIALPSTSTRKLSLAKVVCKEQKNGYELVNESGRARIKDTIEVLYGQKTDDISFIRLRGFNLRREDYLDFIKLFEIESKYKVAICLDACTFEPTNLRSFNWNRMISLSNPIIFEECSMHQSIESIWKYFRNQVDQLTVFYNTHYISIGLTQIENQ